jgi:hypothetical protein
VKSGDLRTRSPVFNWHFLIKLRGTMPVGIGQRGFIRRHVDSQVDQFAQRTGKPIADFAQRIRMRHLAEQHSHQLRPAGEPFGPRSAPCFLTNAANPARGKCCNS